MADEKKDRTLEMRVAELEDKLKQLHVTEDEIKAYQKVSGLLGGAAVSGGSAQPCVAAAPQPCVAASPQVCILRCIVANCIHTCVIQPCIVRCINLCINECGGGCLPGVGGTGGGFGSLGG